MLNVNRLIVCTLLNILKTYAQVYRIKMYVVVTNKKFLVDRTQRKNVITRIFHMYLYLLLSY